MENLVWRKWYHFMIIYLIIIFCYFTQLKQQDFSFKTRNRNDQPTNALPIETQL